MGGSYEWQVGWRYTRAGRSGRRNRFISFISGVSMLGIALGVAALIIVLSVVNGFQSEVRDRMLSVVPHIEIFPRGGGLLPDWQATADLARGVPGVLAVAPSVNFQALVGRGEDLRGAVVRGIEPAAEAEVTPLARELRNTTFATLTPGSMNIVLGVELARVLAVKAGDRVAIVLPGTDAASGAPRVTTFTLSGIFDTGHFEYDNTLVFLHLQDAAKLVGLGGPNGLELRIADQQQARRMAYALQAVLPPNLNIRDWTLTNRNWFDSVQIQKRMLGLILTLIVAVAAFNLVSTLVMTVTDKRADIAILRTLGASPRSIMAIFVVQGAMAGLIGTLAGVVLGLGVALNIDVLVPGLEHLLGVRFLPGNIYFITRMPSLPLASDVVPIAVVSLLLSLAATLYPSWRASRVNPAEALRYE